MLNKRSRIISIRLSEEEFRRLGEICTQVGARSVSDLARQRLVPLEGNGAAMSHDVSRRLWQLDCNLNTLRDEVARLATAVGCAKEVAPSAELGEPEPVQATAQASDEPFASRAHV